MTREIILINEQLNDDELDAVSGGTFIPHEFLDVYYERAGIKIVNHFWKKDEFWYNGKNIGHEKATAVALYFHHNKKFPNSVEQAVSWRKNCYDIYDID